MPKINCADHPVTGGAPTGARVACTAALLAGLMGVMAVPAAATEQPAPVSAARLQTLATTSSANARIASVLPARTSNAVLGSRFTMTVWDTAEDRYVFTKRADASLRGASTTKILTAVAVLEALGPDHNMPTTVAITGSGEIVLRAGGDPLLTSADLRLLASRTATALRTGVPATQTATPQPSATTTASPSASTSASTTPAATPSASASSTSPQAATPTATESTAGPSAGQATTKSVRTAATTRVVVKVDDSLFPGSGQSKGWPNSFLPGQVRPVNAFARDDNKVRDAAADAGRYFTRALANLGIRATYGGESRTPAGATTVARIPGHTIAQAVSRALLVSDNDIAEMLFRQVAVGTGRTADWAGARAAEREVLAKLDIPLSGVEIVDGSGLSLEGRLTAGALTAALNRALTRDRLTGLRKWLPVAGRTGTLRRSDGRFNTSPAKCAAGSISAKTGTLADSIALAGYAAGADGNTKVFVAIVNGRPTRYSRATTRRYVDRAASSITGCW